MGVDGMSYEIMPGEFRLGGVPEERRKKSLFLNSVVILPLRFRVVRDLSTITKLAMLLQPKLIARLLCHPQLLQRFWQH
jgi:hypothetical protein